MSTAARRFPIRYSAPYRVVLSLLGLPPAWSYVELDGDKLRVRMGWAFGADIPLEVLDGVERQPAPVISVGVHGWAGRWLVNGAHTGILSLRLASPVGARVLFVPVRLRLLSVSVEDPDGLSEALAVTGAALD